jgi:hypothetical protein
MINREIKYRGHVQIYLHGNNALEPIDLNSNSMNYYVGCSASNILIRDYRAEAAQAAKRALDGLDEDKFADIFNQPGWVEIRSNNDQAEIEIYESNTPKKSPILWLGVISNSKMAVFDIDWEMLKPIDKSHVAFVALVR